MEGGKGEGEELMRLEKWCLELGEGERRKQFKDIENIFNVAVEKEMELRKC